MDPVLFMEIDVDLNQSVKLLKGIGERRAVVLEKAGIVTINDLICHFPRRYIDRKHTAKISDLELGREITAIGKVVAFRLAGGAKPRFILILRDDSGELRCIWFQGARYMRNAFKIGEWLAVHGKVRFYDGFQITHPEYDRLTDPDYDSDLGEDKIVPLYPSTAELSQVGLDSKGLRRLVSRVLPDVIKNIEENLPMRVIKEFRLLGRRAAYKMIHAPESEEQLEAAGRRLKFEELFYLQLMMALRRRQHSLSSGATSFKLVGDTTRTLLARVPFELTQSQKTALREIWSDMQLERPMNRLLQGDVGSGKTIVALVAMLIAVENGCQAVLMAPTEILAEQHFLNFHNWLNDLGITTALLTGSQNRSKRNLTLEKIVSGEVQIVVGTHALIQDPIEFHRLGLAVIDEQHRFGVVQRERLMKKGENPDILIMTATPIPRTLAMTLYGDLDVSEIQKPPGRKLVKTAWRYAGKRDEVYDFVRTEVSKGRQAYIVFPLVEETEKLDLRAASESFAQLKSGVFEGFNIALLHGRMKPDQKEEVMRSFKDGDCQILVSTTVIEVGIDVKNATVMVIEHAERFGLSQLHQLRGRVGRGKHKSYCILLAGGELSAIARQRLQAISKLDDGFEIADVDLRLRGPGEFFGLRQHGLPRLRIANLVDDKAILESARKEAFSMVANDSGLESIDNRMVRTFFEQYYKDQFVLSNVA